MFGHVAGTSRVPAELRFNAERRTDIAKRMLPQKPGRQAKKNNVFHRMSFQFQDTDRLESKVAEVVSHCELHTWFLFDSNLSTSAVANCDDR